MVVLFMPFTIASTTMIDITPSTIPKMVTMLRTLRVQISAKPMCRDSASEIAILNVSVHDSDHPVGPGCHGGIMSNHDHGVAGLMQLVKDFQDVPTGLGIQIPRGFICQKNGWFIH